jgi:hypothetical protein
MDNALEHIPAEIVRAAQSGARWRMEGVGPDAERIARGDAARPRSHNLEQPGESASQGQHPIVLKPPAPSLIHSICRPVDL